MSSLPALPELLEDLRQQRLSKDALMQRLLSRGAVPPAIHTVEIRVLEEALRGGRLDETLHQLIVARLREIQKAQLPGDRTVTRVNPVPPRGEAATTLNPKAPAADAATELHPGAGAKRAAADPGPADDRTVIPDNTGERKVTTGGFLDMEIEGAPGDLSGQTHFAATQVTGSRTSGTSGPGTSSWKRVAEQASHEPEREVYAGDVLKQRFVLEKEVGRGGMGVVFKATDERKVEAQDRQPHVAVKVLNAEFRKHPQALIALQRESRKAQQLTHDNILRVFDFDKDGTIVYMTMEYVDGGTLKDLIKKYPNGMPYAEAWPVIEGLARGLARAHRDDIVHSDFKPGNVMIGSDRVPKIFDLGIARAAQSGGKAQGETTVFDAGDLGALTPAYASLEMLKGEAPQIPDDIYALGISAYEILTGRHPFNKKNAEEAQKEGLKPARIPGLTRRQWRTLEKALGFARTQRLHTAEAVIDGMRPRTMKDHALPVAIGVGSIMLLLAAVPFVLGRLSEARISGVIEQFEESAFATPDEAVAAVVALNERERETALQRGATPIQDYFIGLANQKWAPSEKRHEYAAAAKLLQDANTLYKNDSKRLGDAQLQIQTEQKQEIDRLNDELKVRVDQGRVFEDQPNNALEILAIVKAIDPKSPMLEAAQVRGRYGGAIESKLRAGDIDGAEKLAATAIRWFPTHADIQSKHADVRARRETQVAALKQREEAQRLAALSPEEVRKVLGGLVALPKFTPEWQGMVDAALSALTRDAAPETAKLRDDLAEAYAVQAATQIDQKSYAVAQLAVDRGLELFPGKPSLAQQKARLTDALRAQQREQASLNAVAEVQQLKTDLVVKAEAGNLPVAREMYAKLQKLAAGDPFVTDEAPRKLGEAYKNAAQRKYEQQQYADAASLAALGMKIAPMMPELKEMESKYRVEGFVADLRTGANKPAEVQGERLKLALDGIAQANPTQHAKLAAELPDTVLKKLEALQATNPDAAGKAFAEWAKVFPQHPQFAGAATEVASAGTTGAGATRTFRRGPDTCNPKFAAFGASTRATCLDNLAGGGKGPRLVVVPGVGGAAPFALTKYEITVKQYNEFCSATGKCNSQSAASEDLPAVRVSPAQAKSYAAWLSEVSGFRYRLPSDAEWTHAATAGGKGTGSDFNCVLMQGANQIKGGAPIKVEVGRANPWGLINIIGNAAELVEGASGPAARGGNFNEPMGRCTAEWADPAPGESGTTGLRLVRELG